MDQILAQSHSVYRMDTALARINLEIELWANIDSFTEVQA